MEDCIFCKIIKKEIPSTIIYEDDDIISFLDIMPVHKGHVLVIPKKHTRNYLSCDDETLKKLSTITKKIANAVKRATNADGINITTNNEESAGQVIFHLHIHIIPRFKNDNLQTWPKTEYKENEPETFKENIIKELNKEL